MDSSNSEQTEHNEHNETSQQNSVSENVNTHDTQGGYPYATGQTGYPYSTGYPYPQAGYPYATNSQENYGYPYSNTQDTQGTYTQNEYPQGGYPYAQGYSYAQEGYPYASGVGASTGTQAQHEGYPDADGQEVNAEDGAPVESNYSNYLQPDYSIYSNYHYAPAEPYSPFSNITVLSEEVNNDEVDSEQVVTNIDEDDLNDPVSFKLFDRLGLPISDITESKMLSVLNNQIADLIELIYETFHLENGKLVMFEGLTDVDETEEKKLLAKDIIEVYFSAKLVALKYPKRFVSNYRGKFVTLKKLFNRMLRSYTNRGEEVISPEDLTILMTLALLVKALSCFLGKETRERIEATFALLLSLTPINEFVDTFKEIMPPSHQSRLFTLSLYRDLQNVEGKLEADEHDQLGKLRAVMGLAIKRYGEFFLRYYADEVKRNLNQDDLMDCPAALLDKSDVSFQLGPSFYVTVIKYQWGIIKDFQGVSVDPLNKSIAFHMQLENLFDFLFDQAQQLFVFTSILHAILNDEETFIGSFSTDADTLIAIYTELMSYLDRLCTGLNNSYDILAQEPTDTESIDRVQQMKLKQLTKVYILLLSFSVCSIQLSLTGPLQITTAPSISAVLENYISKSDFTTPIKDCTVLENFSAEFNVHSVDLIKNYSMIRGLSKAVFSHLQRRNTKVTALNTGVSWNILSFFILMSALLLLQFIWVIQAIWQYAYDKFTV